ncbi:MAG: beta-galactosidase [Candidatus Aminicenantes bacterium]|jgi:hypothetical protein
MAMKRQILGIFLVLTIPFLVNGKEAERTFQIKNHNGAPTLFVDGKPTFYGTWWCPAPAAEEWGRADFARKYAGDTGIHIYAFDVGVQEWRGPGEGRSGLFDFSTVETRFNHILRADPQALFHLRIYLEMNERHTKWWHDMYPEEVEIASDGTHYRQSFASKIWREQVKDFLRQYITHLQDIGLANRVVSYQVGAGHTGEWVKGKLSMYYLTGDYSRPMLSHFRTWLKAKYKDNERLQTAWNDPRVTLDTVEVPTGAEQFQTQHWIFRDPQKEQKVIDYYRCLADLCSELIIDFCRTVKDATRGRSLAGAFYGYLMELAWNAGFFSEGPDSEFSTYQRSGHLGLDRVLDSPYVDFLVSPYSYGFRGIGGEGCSMPPSESMRLHNKLYLFEDDTRTHTAAHPAYGRAKNLAETKAILRRNLAYVISRGQGIWWLVNKGHMDIIHEPGLKPVLEQFQKLGTFALETDRTSCAEIAVLLDDESFFYESVKNDLDFPLIFKQRLVGLPRLGAPCDVFLLDDLLEGRLPPYKLYIFLNAFRLDESRRQALKKEIRKEGRVALWIYAPGYIKNTPSVDNMLGLTGFKFASHDRPWPSFAHITNFKHPMTEGLPQDLFWGTDSRLSPLFHVDDPDAEVLGQVIYSQGTNKPGFCLKTFPDWTSIYIAVPGIPAPVLRNIARFAGVHLYSNKGDVLYASRNLLSVHTLSGGHRTFQLPHSVEVVYDLFEDRIVTQNSQEIQVELEPASTSLFFTGSQELLSRYVGKNTPGSQKEDQ